MTTRASPPREPTSDAVSAEDALLEVLGPGARLWDSASIADRLLAAGYTIRRARPADYNPGLVIAPVMSAELD